MVVVVEWAAESEDLLRFWTSVGADDAETEAKEVVAIVRVCARVLLDGYTHNSDDINRFMRSGRFKSPHADRVIVANEELRKLGLCIDILNMNPDHISITAAYCFSD